MAVKNDDPSERPTNPIREVRCPACIKVKPKAGWCCVLCRCERFVTPEQKANWKRQG